MENNTEKRTDNFGRMKAMDYRDMATFLCSKIASASWTPAQ